MDRKTARENSRLEPQPDGTVMKIGMDTESREEWSRGETSRKKRGLEDKRRLAEQKRQWKRELKRVERDLRRERKNQAGHRGGKEQKGRKAREDRAVQRERETWYDLPFTRAGREIPIKAIKEGIIYTEDGRYVKILEVLPINFLHRSAGEQRNIIYSFMGYLKIAPPQLQMKSVSKKADISGYLMRGMRGMRR